MFYSPQGLDVEQLAMCASEIQGEVDLGNGELRHYRQEPEDTFGGAADPDPEMPSYDAPIAPMPPRTDVRTESRLFADPVRNGVDSGLPDQRGRQSRHSAVVAPVASAAGQATHAAGGGGLSHLQTADEREDDHQNTPRTSTTTMTRKSRATLPHTHLNGQGCEHRGSASADAGARFGDGINGARERPDSDERGSCDNKQLSRGYAENKEPLEIPHAPFGRIRPGIGRGYTAPGPSSPNSPPSSHGNDPHLAAIPHGLRGTAAGLAQGQSRGVYAGDERVSGVAARGEEDSAMAAAMRGGQQQYVGVEFTADGDRTQRQQQQQRDRSQQNDRECHPRYNVGALGSDAGGGGAPNGAQAPWPGQLSVADSARSNEGCSSTSSGYSYLGGATTEPGGSGQDSGEFVPRESPHAGAKRSLDPRAPTKSALGYGSGVKRDHRDRGAVGGHGVSSIPAYSKTGVQSCDCMQPQQQRKYLQRELGEREWGSAEAGPIRDPNYSSQAASSLVPALTGLSLEGRGTLADDAGKKQTGGLDSRNRL